MNEVTRLCRNVIMMMKDGIIIDKGHPEELIKKHGRKNLEEVFLKISRNIMNLIRIYGLFFETFLFNHQIFSKNFRFNLLAINTNNFMGIYIKFFCISHSYYNNAVGVILTCAILYDFFLEQVLDLICYF